MARDIALEIAVDGLGEGRRVEQWEFLFYLRLKIETESFCQKSQEDFAEIV